MARLPAGWPRWTAVVAVLVAVAVAVTWRATAPVDGPPFAPPQEPRPVPSRIGALEEVTAAPDPARLANYRVALANLPVVETAGRAFWVADTRGRRMLVVPERPEAVTAAVDEGRTVSISGAVQTVRGERDREVAELARGESVFIRADSVRLGASPAPPAESAD